VGFPSRTGVPAPRPEHRRRPALPGAIDTGTDDDVGWSAGQCRQASRAWIAFAAMEASSAGIPPLRCGRPAYVGFPSRTGVPAPRPEHRRRPALPGAIDRGTDDDVGWSAGQCRQASRAWITFAAMEASSAGIPPLHCGRPAYVGFPGRAGVPAPRPKHRRRPALDTGTDDDVGWSAGQCRQEGRASTTFVAIEAPSAGIPPLRCGKAGLRHRFSAARSSRRRRQCQRPWAFTYRSM
jgi:hypothetical protein